MATEAYRIEAAMCLWEFALEGKLKADRGESLSPFETLINDVAERNGTLAARDLINDTRMLDACSDGYDALAQEFGEETRDSVITVYDWEYVPFFANNCIDSLGLKSNWKEELFTAFRSALEEQQSASPAAR